MTYMGFPRMQLLVFQWESCDSYFGAAILMAASGVLLSACTTLDPYTQEEKTSNAAKGAMIGAAAGAAVGLLTGDDSAERKKRALIGAGVGAVAGGGVGLYMDNQELKASKRTRGYRRQRDAHRR